MVENMVSTATASGANTNRRKAFALTHPALLFFLLVLISCTGDKAFRISHTLNNANWNRFDFIEFNVPIEQAASENNLDVLFVHSADYPNAYIDMNITLYMPDGTMRSRDYMFDLKDKQGNWLSNQDGDRYTIELPVIHGIRFTEAGNCRIRIENKLTRLDTPGVREVGIVMTKNPDRN
ncbi:MAG: gliding motility lipoprotein GldH [Bacteroidetes bacterium]|nr:gliding motility lipoprotein GldH [Bacteroidota bacterium]